MKRKATITCWCGQYHRNTYSDRNGKVHTRSSTAEMTVCVYCGTLRWRYASRQDLCEKCGQFQPREVKPPKSRWWSPGAS
jgi:hypothetical protein